MQFMAATAIRGLFRNDDGETRGIRVRQRLGKAVPRIKASLSPIGLLRKLVPNVILESTFDEERSV